jgi:3',5'-cyclic AMP phosphodiesterase CpdA
MLRILHLTDLHLSSVNNDQVFDDYKSDLVPPAERNTRTSLLRNTLKELGQKLRRDKKTLDALVVTGDITVANADDGFEQLERLLSQLGTSRPPPERIVVIPGNHDVTWYTPPSTEKRYEKFLRYVRAKGYVTPLLDGIDIDQEGQPLVADLSASTHHLADLAQGWLLLPINSSNYCGSLDSAGLEEEDWNKIPDLLHRGDGDSVRRSLRRARLHDVARISPGQFSALRDLLQDIEQSLDSTCDGPLRIALIHHQLLPVSAREEFKSYESITNLGLLRHFLHSNGIHVVLHGHKHVSHSYWDQLYQGPQLAASPHRVLVISGSTIGGLDYSMDEVCRLLEFRTHKEAPSVSIFQIPAVQPGIRLGNLHSSVVRLWADDHLQPPGHAEVTLVNGRTASEVYSRLLELFETFRPGTLAFNVVCQITDPTGATQLPGDYPSDLFGKQEQGQGAFKEVVEWWQKKDLEARPNLVFTHGSRLASHKQLDRVVRVLRDTKESGHAVVTLLQPEVDIVNQKLKKFPAFCLAQFLITGGNDGQPLQLSCVGYFRKQEVQYWWPVNIAELAHLQREIFAQIKEGQPGLEIGPITTIAAVALCSKTPPQVAIPLIDLLLDMKKDELWEKIYSLVRTPLGDEGSRSDLLAYWNRVLDDLVPAEEPASDGSPVAIDGLDYVATHLQQFSRFHGGVLEDLARVFRDLEQFNERYAGEMMQGQPTRPKHQRWRKDVQQAIAKIRTLLAKILTLPSEA